MKVEQKSYAQILIVSDEDFVIREHYLEFEQQCPFLCFHKVFITNFRTALKEPEFVDFDKDVILILEDYWNKLSSVEKKTILDHELGHIASGHLEESAEQFKKGNLTNEPKLSEEVEADAYSVGMNGKKAMHAGLLKAIDVIAAGARKRGIPLTVEHWIKFDPIMRKRLEILKDD